jgi:hypothetical protein
MTNTGKSNTRYHSLGTSFTRYTLLPYSCDNPNEVESPLCKTVIIILTATNIKQITNILTVYHVLQAQQFSCIFLSNQGWPYKTGAIITSIYTDEENEA